MRIDLHVHLHPHSRGSDLTAAQLAGELAAHNLRAAVATDYGTAAGAAELERAAGGLLVIYGAEIATHEGQFLVFSADRKFAKGLKARLKSIADLPRAPHTAVVWAHPRIPWGEGWRAPFPRQPLTRFIFEHVDAVELYNGSMMAMGLKGAVEPTYHERLAAQIDGWGVAAVGGSGCRSAGEFLSAWTVFPNLRNPQDFITAIKDRAVRPGTKIRRAPLRLVKARTPGATD